MKRLMLIALAIIMMAGCTEEMNEDGMGSLTVNCCFISQTPMKSTLTDATSHIDWQIIQNNTVVASGVQNSTDADYGTINADIPAGTYTIVVFANAGNVPTLNTDGTFTFTKVGDGFAASADFTITRDARTQVALVLTRKTAKVHWTSTDVLPSNVATYQVKVNSTCSIFNVQTDAGSSAVEYTSGNLTPTAGQTVDNYVYVLPPSATATTVTLELIFRDASGNTVYDKTYTNVPVQRNYQTNLSAPMFHENGADATITIDNTWGGTTDVEY